MTVNFACVPSKQYYNIKTVVSWVTTLQSFVDSYQQKHSAFIFGGRRWRRRRLHVSSSV